MENNIIISLKDVCMDYNGDVVLRHLNLDIHNHEFVTLLGPSGCGKTTILRLIGGFLKPKSGDIFFEGNSIVNLPPYKREVNTVFQKYALFPNLDVYDNIAFGLKIKKLNQNEIRNKVLKALDLVGLRGYEKRSVDQLSGGQQQRVAIARALICEPKVLLLDEPLGALDLKLRKEMQIELKKIQRETQITFVYVTHDQEEALTMSDTIVVINKGNILQIGSPIDIYNEPQNSFVADFIGESNILDGIMLKDKLVSFSSHEFDCVDTGFNINENVDVVIRPEDIKISDPENGQLQGTVKSIIFKGVFYGIEVLGDDGYTWKIHSTQYYNPGLRIGMSVIPDDIQIMHKFNISEEYNEKF